MSVATENRVQVTVTVAGRSLDVWDKNEGGGLTTSGETYNAGGMRGKLFKPGIPEEENVKVSRYFDTVRDLALHQWLKQQAAIEAPMTVGKTLLGAGGVPIGQIAPQSGHIVGCSEPESDSTGNGELRIEIEMVVVS